MEFDHSILETTVETIANSKDKKGYVCFVDLNALVYANKHPKILKVINQSTINSCDGSYIAITAGKLYKKQFKKYIGPDFFKKFIYKRNKHLIVGNTYSVFKKIKEKVELSHNIEVSYLSLPFKAAKDFDYDEIADEINNLSPDYIWVSLGAPKQELFMSYLVGKLKRGVLLGVGAALNYFSGEIKDIPEWIKKLHIIWLYRIFTEPKKQIVRMSKVFLEFPAIYAAEKRKIKKYEEL